jgi:hypothetical protein
LHVQGIAQAKISDSLPKLPFNRVRFLSGQFAFEVEPEVQLSTAV